jgi:hypothetical protein
MGCRTTALPIIMLLAASLEAGVVPPIQVDNKPSAMIEIVPLDDLHMSSAPQSLGAISTKLPPGSFVLKNHTDTPVTVIVAVWNYTDADGKLRHRRVNFDSYLIPSRDPLVEPHDLALVTPFGCATRDLFVRLESGTFLGSPLDAAGETPVSAAPGTTMHLYVDSVFFADGRIWGPDKFDYSAVVRERHDAIQSFTAEVSAGWSAGQDISPILSRILADARGRVGKASALRARYARMLQNSPNAEATLEQLKAEERLPEFRHTEGDRP